MSLLAVKLWCDLTSHLVLFTFRGLLINYAIWTADSYLNCEITDNDALHGLLGNVEIGDIGYEVTKLPGA